MKQDVLFTFHTAESLTIVFSSSVDFEAHQPGKQGLSRDREALAYSG